MPLELRFLISSWKQEYNHRESELLTKDTTLNRRFQSLDWNLAVMHHRLETSREQRQGKAVWH